MKQYYIGIFLVISAIIASIYFFINIFWMDFLPNFLATFLGAIIGIPIAIGINNYIEKQVEKERKNKIIPLLREELLVNMVHLASWQKSQTQKIELVYKSILLETSSWDGFFANGDLTSISDPETLIHVSHAYNSIRIVKSLTERYMDLVCLPVGEEREMLLSLVGKILSKGINEAIIDIRNTAKNL